MPVFKVNVKWGKEKFSDVECNTNEPPEVFKAQLFALSGDDGWGNMKLKDGAMLLMMGTAEDLPMEPAQKTVFMEDMTDQQLASALEVPGGLTNLGNTCYMNATIQCLRSVPELKDALKRMPMNTASASSASGFMDQYFAGEFQVTMKCEESEEEPATKSTEKFLQLSCFIEKDVKYMHTGLRSRLEEHITKNSPTLGRDAVFKKSNKISRLPAYLTIQFVRFFYKEKESVNAKILKLKAANKKPDVGSNNSGYYELQAVLTHKGRSSSSGHYVAWVKRKGDEWLMFDDDNVTAIYVQ
ncbi:UBP14-like protein [Mya arenaria]|uniref:ubiquitinyl hydrolase 1 n=1 Tax=Mya arenaria TaxID=6604 RepID=A0ABY7FQ50_MYAAR|nr:UBP14-like protein [Mya arenaria]